MKKPNSWDSGPGWLYPLLWMTMMVAWTPFRLPIMEPPPVQPRGRYIQTPPKCGKNSYKYTLLEQA